MTFPHPFFIRQYSRHAADFYAVCGEIRKPHTEQHAKPWSLTVNTGSKFPVKIAAAAVNINQCRLQLFQFRCTSSHLVVGESADLRPDTNKHCTDTCIGGNIVQTLYRHKHCTDIVQTHALYRHTHGTDIVQTLYGHKHWTGTRMVQTLYRHKLQPNGHTLDRAPGSPTDPFGSYPRLTIWRCIPLPANAIFAVFDVSSSVYGNHWLQWKGTIYDFFGHITALWQNGQDGHSNLCKHPKSQRVDLTAPHRNFLQHYESVPLEKWKQEIFWTQVFVLSIYIFHNGPEYIFLIKDASPRLGVCDTLVSGSSHGHGHSQQICMKDKNCKIFAWLAIFRCASIS